LHNPLPVIVLFIIIHQLQPIYWMPENFYDDRIVFIKKWQIHLFRKKMR